MTVTMVGRVLEESGVNGELGGAEAGLARPGGRDAAGGEPRWREQPGSRSPYGRLTAAGTHRIEGASSGRIEGLPGRWWAAADGRSVLLEAEVADGLAVDGVLLGGRITLVEDAGEPAGSRVSYGERRLVVVRDEEGWAVRLYAPQRLVEAG